MILDRILAHKKAEVQQRKAAVSKLELALRAEDVPEPLSFGGALRRDDRGVPAVIAEVKKASPSKGLIRADFNPVEIARCYESGGAAAISVLTDEEFFQGSLAYLTAVKQAVSLPVLRKDFVVDEYQVFEARAAGADALLLIAAALDDAAIRELMAVARGLGMQCLVEVHDEPEMERALALEAGLIGINNRNLRTFEVRLDTTERLMRMTAGSGCTFVSESGISSRDDMLRVGECGVEAVLVGEALMREADIASKLRELVT